MLVDSHCHLNFPELLIDLPQVLQRAQENGVETLLTISTSITSFIEVVKVAARSERIFASVGIHPAYIKDEAAISSMQISALCAGEKVVAIGETGLDYHYPDTDKEAQKANFIEHIKAAQFTRLPLIVHTRDADGDTLAILADAFREKPFKCLIHCFTSSEWLAHECIKLGCYISVSGIISFKNSTTLQETIKTIPLERLLVETDSPYLAPAPHRGKRNEPAFVKHVAETLASLKEVSYDEVIKTTGGNFYRLFDKVKRP